MLPDLIETKSIGPLELAAGDTGEVTALVNTLNIVDRDGDVILPGAIQSGTKVKMSGYAHSSAMGGEAPVGKGVLTVDGDNVIFKGSFFMTTQRGRESYETVKALGADSEWSIGYLKQVKTTDITPEWKAKGARRAIVGMKAFEVSPVIIGANQRTGTLSVKEADEEALAAAAAEKAEVDRAAAEVEAKAKAEADLKTFSESVARDFARFERTMKRRA